MYLDALIPRNLLLSLIFIFIEELTRELNNIHGSYCQHENLKACIFKVGANAPCYTGTRHTIHIVCVCENVFFTDASIQFLRLLIRS